MATPEEIRTYFLSLIGPNRRFKFNSDMAEFLGLGKTTATTLYNFLKGAKTQYAYVIEWLEKLGGSVVLPEQALDGFVFVPRVKAVAGAGESFEIDTDVAKMYAFRESFMHYLGVNAKNVVMMYVRGDSMEPLIYENDMVLIDQNDTSARDGYIYVLSLGDALMVKRMQKTPRGWNVCSENKNYPPIPVEGQELDALCIRGRVRWFGRVV